jgi:hypothetical protein
MADEQAVSQEAQAPQANPDLSITDLQNLRAIIDVASTRGAFKAAEMAAVGTVFNKLDAFLNAVAAQANANTAAQQATPPAQ